MLCLCQFGLAQQRQRIGQFERVNDSIFIIGSGKRYVADPNVITVKLMSGVSIGELNLNVISSNRLGYMNISVPHGIDIEDYVSMLDLTGKFEVVEYNTFVEFCGMPNDTYIGNQWYLDRVNVFSAWSITMGSSDVIVGVIDSGVDWEHDDIGYGNDGYKNIDESKGWCFHSNTNTTKPTDQHGTLVAGVIGAKTNNSKWVAGISGGNGSSSGVTMIPISVDGLGGAFLAEAIIYAVDSGARIINMSLTIWDSHAINDAIDDAIANNVLIVAASGNYRESTVRYPASHKGVIAVGAINKNDRRSNYSNYGSALNVVAPGDSIYTTWFHLGGHQTGNFVYTDSSLYINGTSFATPIVSGVAALILSVNPTLKWNEVRDIIERTAQKVDGYDYATTPGRRNGTWHQEVGHGLVDAHAAVLAASGQIIFGSDSIICSETYMVYVPDGCSVTWSVEPDDAFTIIDTNANPVTVMATSFSGQTGTLTATYSKTSISKPIKAASLAISGPDELSMNHFGIVTYKVENLPPSAYVDWTYDDACFLRVTFPPGSGPRPLMVTPNPDIEEGCHECSMMATVYNNGCEVTLPSKTVHVGYPPDADLISSVHNLDSMPYGSLDWCVFYDTITYNNEVPYSNNGFGILQGLWRNVRPAEVSPITTTLLEIFNPDMISGISRNLKINAVSNGMARIEVQLKNQCGWSDPAIIAYYPKTCGKIVIVYSPNPVNSELTIEFEQLPDTDNPVEYTVKLLDNLGNAPRQNRFRHRHRDGKPRPIKFNTYSLSPGTYYLHVEGGGELVREQIIVTR